MNTIALGLSSYLREDWDNLDVLWGKLVSDYDYSWVVMSNMMEEPVEDIVYFGVVSGSRSMNLNIEEN